MTDGLFLREKDRLEIVRLLARHLPNVTAWAYGSRVNGGAHDGSDLDIVLRSPDLSPLPLEKLRAFTQAVRDSNIPILVEARDWARLPESFQQEIMKNYVVLRETVSEWEFFNLNNYYSFSSGLSKGSEFFGSGYDFVSFKDVFDNFFLPKILSAKVQSTESERQSMSVKKGDVFLTRTSETEEELGMSSVALKDYPNATFNGFTKRLRPNKLGKERIVPQFIGYYFRTKKFRSILTSISSITTRASLNNSMLNTLQIPIPPLHEQKAIASVLSSLDDKIDLLHRQNKTLEAMAEALFRQWFVEEAGEDWEEITIGETLTVKGGSTPSTKISEYWDGDIHWTTPKDLSKNNSIYLLDTDRKISLKGLAKISSGLLSKGTLLLSSRAPVGYLAFSKVPLAINQGYIAIINDKDYSKYFIYLWLKANMEYVKSYSNGSTFQEISKTSFKSLQLLAPPKDKRSKFDEIIKPLFEKIELNADKIRTLEKLRDTLLPKLMSGEVRVAC